MVAFLKGTIKQVLAYHDDRQFWGVYGAAAHDDFVYVADSGNNRVLKYDNDGNFITMWGSLGQGSQQFQGLEDITVDSSDDVYVTESNTNRIQKFDSDGNFITKWGSNGTADGQFKSPTGIATDSSDDVYVADNFNNRIQKFDSDGNFITKWGSLGQGNLQFMGPEDIAVDSSDDVYVADNFNNRIQKFDSDGNFITTWGSNGTGDGQFKSPTGIATDSSDDVYVADNFNNRIQKFDSDGDFITKWGSECLMRFYLVQSNQCVDPDGSGPLSTGDGQFQYPYDIAVDSSDDVYVADNFNNRIQKFDSDGDFITKWGSTNVDNDEDVESVNQVKQTDLEDSNDPGGNLQTQTISKQEPPLPDSSDTWHFIAVGDWGSNNETIKTVENIGTYMDKTTGVEFVLGLGDYSYYETGEEIPTVKWWNEIMKPLQNKFKAALGNHEINEIPLYKKLFGLNSTYYSFDHKSVHFISINALEPLDATSPQFRFLKSDLDNAQNDPNIKWVIPFLHHPLYTAKSMITGDGTRIGSGYNERLLLHPLFDNYSKVDLVLNAHSHNYQRTFPLLYNNHTIEHYPFAYLEDPTITGSDSHHYTDVRGQIYLTVGTAGAPLHRTEDYPPSVNVQNVKYGFLDIEVRDNGNTLVGKFYPNDHKQVGLVYDDYFVIRK